MDFWALAKGFLAGAAIAAPLGPVGVVCLQRGLASGRAAAFLSGLGAATAHGAYALAAALGLSLVSGVVARHGSSMRAVAALLLCLFGARILFVRPADPEPAGRAKALAGAYSSTLLLAISSPVTMLTIAAVFSGAGLPAAGAGKAASLLLAAGVFLGSAFWWLALSAGAGWLAQHGGVAAARTASRVAGAFLLGFGVYILIGLFAAS